MRNTIFAFLALSFFPLQSMAAPSESFVSVRGEGEVKVKPDMAELHLNVQTKAKDARQAQEKNAKEMDRVQKVLKAEFDIPAKDIQTSNFNVNPDYRWDNNKQIFLGYTVQHGLTVRLKKLEKVGALLDKLIGKGTEDVGVHLNRVNFETEKRKEIELQALEAAMENAQKRAEALAKFAKRSIKQVIRISDSNISYQPLQPIHAASMKSMTDMSEAGTQISEGEIVIQASVAVDYSLD